MSSPRRSCAEPGCSRLPERRRRRCDDHRRSPAGRERPSRTTVRADGRGKRAAVYSYLTEVEWRTLYDYQTGACAVCATSLMNRYDPGSTQGKIAYVDHSHSLEKVVGVRKSIRGLLCLWCNRHVLVTLHDSPARAQAAFRYLQYPPAPRVLNL